VKSTARRRGRAGSAAMPPSTATLSACPVTRIVARKALASPSWCGATLPMMALALGALNEAMPTPTRASPARTSGMPASARHRRQQRHAGRGQQHARRRQQPRADTVAQTPAQRAQRRLHERLGQQDPACHRRRPPLDDLQVDHGEHADRREREVVEEGGAVGRGEQPVAAQQLEIDDRVAHPALGRRRRPRRRPPTTPRSASVPAESQPHCAAKVSGTSRPLRATASSAAPARSGRGARP
jgi:hypothetical protein